LYGSRNWNPESHALSQGLGERLDVPQEWNEGAAPAWPVRAVAVGSKDCIANGDLIADGVPYAATFDGIIEACIIKQNPDDVLWTKVSDYQNCNVQRMYAFVILAMANDDGISVDRILRAFVGVGPVISFHKSDGVFNGVCTVTSATWQLVLFDGTRNAQQFALQAFNAIAGPQDFGGISTNPFWFDASTVAMAKMIGDGQAAGMRLMCVGHSYGGAVACLVAARNRQADALRAVVYMTFGCPKIGDLRFVNVLQTCKGICISNDGDIVTILPPDAKTLAPILPLFPAFDLLLWARWHRPMPQALLFPDGHFQPNAQVPTDTATILALVADVIAQQNFDPVTQHFLVGYVGRLYARCPDCCFPNQDPVCAEILIANPVLALTSAKRNPRGLILRPGVEIIVPDGTTCLKAIPLAAGVLHTLHPAANVHWYKFAVSVASHVADLTYPDFATAADLTAQAFRFPCGGSSFDSADLGATGLGTLHYVSSDVVGGYILLRVNYATGSSAPFTVQVT
jgi:pimeloyl-ACP methyl ester carboxylesterase